MALFQLQVCSDMPGQLRLGKSKVLQTGELLYLKNKLRYKLDFLHVITHA